MDLEYQKVLDIAETSIRTNSRHYKYQDGAAGRVAAIAINAKDDEEFIDLMCNALFKERA